MTIFIKNSHTYSPWLAVQKWGGARSSSSSGKGPACPCRRHKRRGFYPWVRKIPCRRAEQPTPVFMLENSMDRRAWWATVHGVTKSQTQLTQLSTQHISKDMYKHVLFTIAKRLTTDCRQRISWGIFTKKNENTAMKKNTLLLFSINEWVLQTLNWALKSHI